MRIFLAGGSGVLGRALIPMLVAEGHEVTATTRSSSRTALLRGLGATPAIMDALDREAVRSAVARARPDAIVHQLTDLTTGNSASNARLRTIGTRNLMDAARDAAVDRIVAQSISWMCRSGTSLADETEPLDTDPVEPRRTSVAGVESLESAVLESAHGVVLRYGQLYGPGTWYSRDGRFGEAARSGALPATEGVTSFVHVDDAARATLNALSWPGGIWNIVDDEPASGRLWAPFFAEAIGAPIPRIVESGDIGRPVSNARARGQGLELAYSSWREGFLTL